jgi:dTDP-glucose 4,6-dehydratase
MDVPGGNGSIRRAAVLGGAGFTGWYLRERLRRDGSAAVCVDDLSTGDAGDIGHLTDLPRFELVEGGGAGGAQAATPLFGEPARAARRTV